MADPGDAGELRIRGKDGLAQVPRYEYGKPESELRRELGIDRIIKLASNENPLGPSPKALEALHAGRPEIHRYPDSSYFELRARLCEHVGVSDGMTIVGCGSSEIMKWLCEALLEPGDEVLASDITFPIYHTLPLLFEARARPVPLRDDLSLDMDALLRPGDEKTKAVIVASPNNPTGLLVTREQIEEMLRRVPPDRLIVLDQAYVEYAPDGYAAGTVDLLRKHRNLMLLRSFSKVYGLAGLRVGYGIANDELIELLDRVRLPFSVNAFAERAALAALDDEEHVRRSVEMNAQGKALLTEGLRGLGLRVWDTHANFLLFDCGRPSQEIFEALLPRGIIVRPMRAARIATTVRLTIGTMDENEFFLRALREVL